MTEHDERIHDLDDRRRRLYDKLCDRGAPGAAQAPPEPPPGAGGAGNDRRDTAGPAPSREPPYPGSPGPDPRASGAAHSRQWTPPGGPPPGWGQPPGWAQPGWPPSGWGQPGWGQPGWQQAAGAWPGAGGWPGGGWFDGGGPGPWGGWPDSGAAVEKGPLIGIKQSGSRPPLFCIHAILGSVFPYHQLALGLEPDRPCYGLQARGLLPGEEPRETIEAMAEAYIAEIRKVRPHGPYHLGGYSFGGWVAWEMAQRLGAEVGLLAVLGVPIPATAVWPALGAQAEYLIRYARDWQRLVRHSSMAEGLPDWEARLAPSQRVVWANGWAQARWVPKARNARMDLFLTTEQAAVYAQDPTMGWARLCTGEVRTHRLDGNHLNLFQSPQVEQLAGILVHRMQQLEGSA